MMEIWNLVGGEEVRPKNFNMNNARGFFYNKRAEFPQTKSCALKVTPRGNRYEIIQLMLDNDMNPLKVNRDFGVGRRLLADNISQDVVDFLGGKSWKILE